MADDSARRKGAKEEMRAGKGRRSDDVKSREREAKQLGQKILPG